VDNATLNRFFSLHYLLPFMIAGVVMLHIWALHVPGNNNPVGIAVKDKQDTLPFHPYYTVKDSFALVAFLVVLAWFVFFAPNILGHPDNYIPADPLKTPAHIVPEWYFLPFYAILRAIPNKLFGVIAMFSSIAIWVVLPWLDTSRVRSANFRPLFKQFFWIFVLVCIGLGWLGAKPAEGGYVIASRILTAYYFAHFIIILPLLGLFERPRPLPASIAQSVLGRHSAPAGTARA
jgi:ubiquinol-cytochrome c reductase cytochrome b/c1 subunit